MGPRAHHPIQPLYKGGALIATPTSLGLQAGAGGLAGQNGEALQANCNRNRWVVSIGLLHTHTWAPFFGWFIWGFCVFFK